VRCFVVARFLLTGASRCLSAIAELLVFYLHSLLSNSSTGQNAYHIFMLDVSNDADSPKGVPCLALVDIVAYSEDQIAPKPQFVGV